MPDELELKAVIPDVGALRGKLVAAGAVEGFRGLMADRRYDRDGSLAARDEVLRVRRYHRPDGHADTILAWKGPTRRSVDGYKLREEIELAVTGSPHQLLLALGYEVVHAVDRDVELFALDGATARLEHYPSMDPLLEVEGPPAAMERVIRATGIERAAFTADSLAEFVRRYEARTGSRAVLSRS